MLRPRPFATVTTALALLAGALLFAPFGSSRGAVPKLSPTPPVALAPPSSAPTSTTTGTPAPPRPQLPKTGLRLWLVVLVGLALMTTGAAMRRTVRPVSRRYW